MATKSTPTFNDHTALYMYREGFSDKKIADALGCRPHVISSWRRKKGLSSNGRQGRPYSFDTSKADLLIQAGVPSKKIAELLDVSRETIRRYRKKAMTTT